MAAAGAIVDHPWQRRFYFHLDAFPGEVEGAEASPKKRRGLHPTRGRWRPGSANQPPKRGAKMETQARSSPMKAKKLNAKMRERIVKNLKDDLDHTRDDLDHARFEYAKTIELIDLSQAKSYSSTPPTAQPAPQLTKL